MSVLISKQGVINAIENTDVKLTKKDWDELMDAINVLPSAEVEDRLYIKIYADDEPSVMAEKLYQICGETQNGEVAEWLKEYFPSAPDSRQRGEWVYGIDEETGEKDAYPWTCSVCNKEYPWQPNFCPNCGADMRKPKWKYGDTDTLQGGLMSAT